MFLKLFNKELYYLLKKTGVTYIATVCGALICLGITSRDVLGRTGNDEVSADNRRILFCRFRSALHKRSTACLYPPIYFNGYRKRGLFDFFFARLDIFDSCGKSPCNALLFDAFFRTLRFERVFACSGLRQSELRSFVYNDVPRRHKLSSFGRACRILLFESDTFGVFCRVQRIQKTAPPNCFRRHICRGRSLSDALCCGCRRLRSLFCALRILYGQQYVLLLLGSEPYRYRRLCGFERCFVLPALRKTQKRADASRISVIYLQK